MGYLNCKRLGVALLLTLLTLCSFAQTGSGRVQGKVVDTDGESILTAIVEVSGGNLLQPKRVLVDEEGSFFMHTIPPGEYTITARDSDGLYSPSSTSIRININKTATVNFTMVEIGGTTVTVVASTPKVDLDDPSVGGTLSQTEIQETPLVSSNTNGRRYQDYLSLIPGTRDPDNTGNYYIHGMENDKVGTTFGGVSTRDPASGTFGANLNSDVIEEIEVITTAPPAEYGRALGGFVNVVTKSGGDEVKGNLSLIWRSSKFDSNGSTKIPEDSIDFDVYDIGGTLSGPLIKKKLWYLVSFQKVDLEMPNAVFGGTHTRNFFRDALYYNAKLTWQVTEKHKLILEYFRGDEDLTNLELAGPDGRVMVPDEAGDARVQSNTIVSLNWEWLISNNLVLKAAVSQFKSRLLDQGKDEGKYYRPEELYYLQQMGGDAALSQAEAIIPVGFDVYPIVDRYAGRYLYYGNWSNPYDRVSKVQEARVSLDYFVDDFFGRHSIKGGIQYSKAETTTNRPTSFSYFNGYSYSLGYLMTGLSSLSDYTYPGGYTLAEVWQYYYCPSMYVGGADALNYRCWLPYLRFNYYMPEYGDNYQSVDENIGIFIQDTWNVTENLTFQLGLRYDQATATADGYAMDLVDTGLVTRNADTGQIEGNLASFGSSADILAAMASYQDSFGRKNTEISYGGWSPRFAMTFDLFGDDRTKVRASWARLTDLVQTFYSGFEGRINKGVIGFTYSYMWGGVGFESGWSPDWAAGNLTGDIATTPEFGLGGGYAITRHFLPYVDPNIEVPFADEWSVGFEREIFPNTFISVDYIGKRSFRDIIATTTDAASLSEGDGSGTDEDNPFFGAQVFIQTARNQTGDEGGIDYSGVDMSLQKRLANNWWMTVNYTYSRTRAFNQITDPRSQEITTVFGYAFHDVRHELNIFGAWHLPYDFRVGWRFRWQSGFVFLRSWGSDFPTDITDGSNYNIVDGRTPSFWRFDVNVEKDFTFGRHNLSLLLDIEDILNSRFVRHSAGRVSSGYRAADGKRGNVYNFGRRWAMHIKWEF